MLAPASIIFPRGRTMGGSSSTMRRLDSAQEPLLAPPPEPAMSVGGALRAMLPVVAWGAVCYTPGCVIPLWEDAWAPIGPMQGSVLQSAPFVGGLIGMSAAPRRTKELLPGQP